MYRLLEYLVAKIQKASTNDKYTVSEMAVWRNTGLNHILAILNQLYMYTSLQLVQVTSLKPAPYSQDSICRVTRLNIYESNWYLA